MTRQTKAEKEAAALAAAAAAGAGDPPPPATPASTPSTRKPRRSAGGALTGHPLDVMIGVGVESTHIDGVEYVVDPETGRVTGTA